MVRGAFASEPKGVLVARAGMLIVLLLLIAACSPAQGSGGNNAPGKAPGTLSNQPVGKKAPAPLEPQSGDYLAFDGGLRVYPKEKRVELTAYLVGGQSRPLEFFLVSGGGALHESLFSTAASAEHLKRGLEIISLKQGRERRFGRGYLEQPTGDKVLVSIRFRHARTGATTTVRAEDWLWDTLSNTNPEPVGFVFTGGYEEFAPDQNRQILSADQLGNYIAMWHDASCILDNARKHGTVSDCYTPNPEAPGMPPAGSEVTLIFEASK